MGIPSFDDASSAELQKSRGRVSRQGTRLERNFWRRGRIRDEMPPKGIWIGSLALLRWFFGGASLGHEGASR
eukprot:7310172-Pyramimonas_sp.AAC.1